MTGVQTCALPISGDGNGANSVTSAPLLAAASAVYSPAPPGEEWSFPLIVRVSSEDPPMTRIFADLLIVVMLQHFISEASGMSAPCQENL